LKVQPIIFNHQPGFDRFVLKVFNQHLAHFPGIVYPEYLGYILYSHLNELIHIPFFNAWLQFRWLGKTALGEAFLRLFKNFVSAVSQPGHLPLHPHSLIPASSTSCGRFSSAEREDPDIETILS
jgi:hypothetical protein